MQCNIDIMSSVTVCSRLCWHGAILLLLLLHFPPGFATDDYSHNADLPSLLTPAGTLPHIKIPCIRTLVLVLPRSLQ